MPTPVGHALAGIAVSRLSRKRPGLEPVLQLGVCLFMGIAPDLDFLPGLLLNQPALFHGEYLHSIGVAFLASLGLAAFLRLLGKPFRTVFFLGFFAYTSHLVLDMLQPDGRVPYGIPFLWPFSGEYFLSPVPLLLGVHHVGSTSSTTAEFIDGVLSWHNLLAITVEVLVLTPFLFLRRVYEEIWIRRSSEMQIGGD
jgi:inner membrane protein